jgi:hypothetical protein
LTAHGGGEDAAVDRDLYVMLWIDDGAPQAALYDDREQAEADAELVGGRIEVRAVHRCAAVRTGRFIRGEG